MTRNEGILLVGPTGAGKSPLGDLLAESGLGGKRCVHFDFGENLRGVAAGKRTSKAFSQPDLQIVEEALTKGLLLENESFHIARKILHAFMEEMSVGAQDLLIMNGLPRHIGQAKDTDQLVNISAILSLECTPQIVQARINRNTGGDRTHRIDDSFEAVKAKLKTFEGRTYPLLDHYTSMGVPVHTIKVNVETTPAQMLEMAVKILS